MDNKFVDDIHVEDIWRHLCEGQWNIVTIYVDIVIDQFSLEWDLPLPVKKKYRRVPPYFFCFKIRYIAFEMPMFSLLIPGVG